MTVIESIVRDLNSMPMRKLVEVARYVHRLSETVERERAEVLHETHGCLSDEDGSIFELALENSRRIQSPWLIVPKASCSTQSRWCPFPARRADPWAMEVIFP